MDRLKCKACGSLGMVPVELDDLEPDEDDLDGDLEALLDDSDEETRFFSCHVCGDNWLTVRRVDHEGDCRITFVHQMGLRPTLRRVARMQTPIVLTEATVDGWDYYLGDDEVEESEWRARLDGRRSLLRSICCN